jgi:hypothetical protein
MRLDINTPLPEHFFTRSRAVLMGLAIGVTVITGFSIHAWLAHRLTPDPAVAPICYGSDEANYTPNNQPIPLRGAPGRGEPSIDQRRDQSYLERMIQAEGDCKVNACSRDAFAAYKSALFWYLATRLGHTRKLDREYGQLGLRRASDIYNEPHDVRIERGLRERYRAGIFRINDFSQNREAVAILVLKGGAGLRPCRRADVASR